MKFRALAQHKFFRPALASGLSVFCGLALWQMPLGESWVNGSYDYLFRFASRSVTNEVVLILMDNEACKSLGEDREHWNRGLHAKLLNKLADDRCPLVALDTFFRAQREPTEDAELAGAMRRLDKVVLMALQADAAHPDLVSAAPILPADLFLSAARTNWGVAWLTPNLDGIVRQHWPFPAPGPYHSLPWTASRLAGAPLSENSQQQWLRYYGPNGPWNAFSYNFALTQATNYFHNKIVFVGSKPSTSIPDGEADEFRTPYTRWTGESAGGVEILATLFLNLMNDDWLRRPGWWTEALLLVLSGTLLGSVLSLVRPLTACWIAAAAALIVTLGGVSWSYFTNSWFPWLVIAGGQAPSALACALVGSASHRRVGAGATVRLQTPSPTVNDNAPTIVTRRPDVPETPDYELFSQPFAEGGYGKVWLARNAIGQWQALKAVYQSKFRDNIEPYEREFRGITRYKPVSGEHPGLLRVDFVSMKKPEGFFYYVMELGDAEAAGWQENPASYKPSDLASVCARAEAHRLPVLACARIGSVLADALSFLHGKGLTHRDIKPSNIIFVNGRPKLADIGLVAHIRLPEEAGTLVGTPGYMPPLPEPPGTVQADIYGLGMVLYVISTGRGPTFFPDLSTTLIERMGEPDFLRLNRVIIKACQPDASQRYGSAAEMLAALLEIQKALENAESTAGQAAPIQ